MTGAVPSRRIPRRRAVSVGDTGLLRAAGGAAMPTITRPLPARWRQTPYHPPVHMGPCGKATMVAL